MAKRPLNASWQTATAGLPASPRDSDPRTRDAAPHRVGRFLSTLDRAMRGRTCGCH